MTKTARTPTIDKHRQRKQPGMQIDVELYARMKALAALRKTAKRGHCKLSLNVNGQP